MKTFASVCCGLAIAASTFGQAGKKFADLAEIQAHFDKQKLAAIEAWIKDPANKDKLDFAKAKAEAAFLKVDVAAKTETNGAAIKEAHAGFIGSLDNDGVQQGMQVTGMVAERLVDLDAVQDAVAVWKAFGEKFSAHRAAAQIKQIVESETGDLELLGKEPKAFDVKDMKDQPLSLEKYKGKVVLIDFWATWCGPCIAELPNVIAAYKKYQPKGFEVIGISLDKEDKTVLDNFLSKHPDMTWQQYYDGKFWKNDLAVLYGVQSIPATYLLDKEGKVYRVGLRGPALEKAIEKLLSKKS